MLASRCLLFQFLIFCLSGVACAPRTSVPQNDRVARYSELKTNVFYGDDYRQEPYENSNPTLRRAALSTVAIVNVDRLKELDVNHTQIQGPEFGQLKHFCPGERYLDQIAGSDCSGFLLAPDLIVTAGHCISDDYDCQMHRYVFDYAKSSPLDPGNRVLKSSIYECGKLIYSQRKSADFAVIQLSRPVLDRDPLPIRRDGEPNVSEALNTAGFPFGIPMKLVDHGMVREVQKSRGVMITAVDLFNGNSGGPIFDAQSGKVEGIVTSGETDFVSHGDCYASRLCQEQECSGETVTLSENFKSFAPQQESTRTSNPSTSNFEITAYTPH